MRRNPLLMTVTANPCNGRTYRENPFILIDSATNKVIRSWKGPMTSPRPWDWAKDAARRLGRPVFVVAHPYVPQTFRAGVEVSPLFFFGGPFEEVRPDGSMGPGPAGGYKKNPPGFLPSFAGGIAGTIVANAFSNPPRSRKGAENALDKAIEQAWYRHASGVQVSIMDIPRIFRDIKLEMAAGVDLDTAAVQVANRYRSGGAVARNPYVVVDRPSGRVSSVERGRDPGAMARAYGWAQDVSDWERRPQDVHRISRATRVRVGERFKGSKSNPASRKAQRFMSSEISHLMKKRGYTQKRAVAAAYSMAREKGYKLNSNPHGDVTLRQWAARQPVRISRVGNTQTFTIPDVRGLVDRAEAWRLSDYFVSSVSGGSIWFIPRSKVRMLEVDRRYKRRFGGMQRNEKGYKLNGRHRKITMSLEKFAQYLKKKGDPKLWADFVRKIKGYQKWTHGTLPKTVTVEVVDKPGVSGLWLTYDAGKVPESAYVMPKGSKRKGAWKHPWETGMPSIKHDPEAGIVMHKLTGKNRISDFYHK